MKYVPALLSLLALALICAMPAEAGSNRMLIADQSNWGAKQGFVLDCENDAPDGSACPLSTLKLIVGAADGTEWRYLRDVGPWAFGHEYKVVGKIADGNESLTVDGVSVGQTAATMIVGHDNLNINMQPDWARADADYQIVIDHVTVQSGKASVDKDFSNVATRSAALVMLQPNAPTVIQGGMDLSSNSVTVTASFHFAAKPSLKDVSPLIDQYGQVILATFPGKVATDADLDPEGLAENQRLNQIGTPPGFDQYGGRTDLGWMGKSTGYFHVEKHNGTWWMVTPGGSPCFYTSVCSVPSLDWDGTPITGREGLYSSLPDKTGPFADAWKTNMWGSDPGVSYFSFRAANLIRKFSGDWRTKETNLSLRRLRTLGFSGVSKWGGVDGLPNVPVLHVTATKLLRHYDIFDSAVAQQIVDSLTSQIKPHLTDTDIVGWSIGNEYDEIITPDEVTDILKRDAGTLAKKALVDEALKTIYSGDVSKLSAAWKITASTADEVYANQTPQPPADDLEALRKFYADKYYAFLYSAVKTIDPNHLYLGFWIVPNWWVNDSDWALIAAHVDVIGYDRYADQFADDAFSKLLASTDMPAYCGEFSYPSDFDGLRGFGRYATRVSSEEDAGLAYERWIDDAATNPHVVGGGWFEYHDEPITGRGSGHGQDLTYGEDYAFGLYTEQDQPRWTLLTHMRKANLAAATLRNTVVVPGTN